MNEYQYYQDLVPILTRARDLALPGYGTAPIERLKSDSAADVVTEFDVRVEAETKAALQAKFPHVAFVGEESGGNAAHERYWLMDPIDGTGHFVRGLPFCSVMLALVEHGIVSAGAVLLIQSGDLYYAEKGKGTTKNGVPISVSSRSLTESYLAYESRLDHGNNLATYVALRRRTALMKSLSAGYEFAMVAEGKIEGRVNVTPWGNDYDFAPGSLLVSEAGGRVANLGKETYEVSNTDLIAANPKVFQELTDGAGALFPITH